MFVLGRCTSELILVMMSDSRIPRLHGNTYTDNVEGGYMLVYNPLSEKGVAVLNKEAAFLFQQIDQKKTLHDIFLQAQGLDRNVDFHDVASVFENFFSSEIIYFDTPRVKNKFFRGKPKHLGVWLHITNQCNLRCTYCYVWKTHEKMSDATARKAIVTIVRDAVRHGFEKIIFKFAGGECLLAFPLILDLVREGRRLAGNVVAIDFVVLTNGVLITEDVARKLKEERIKAAVSLDGLGEYNDAQRIFPSGLGSFQYVERGIQSLQHERVPFNVSVTITARNVENVPQLTHYLLERSIPFAFNFYRENPYVKEAMRSDEETLIACLKKAYGLISQCPPRHSVMNGLLDRVVFTRPHVYTCGMGNSYLVVRHDGKIAPCPVALDEVSGSIDDEDVIDTMQRSQFAKRRNVPIERRTSCMDCQWKYICCGGCPLLNFEPKTGANARSPYCAVYKALIPEVLKVEAKRLLAYGTREAQELPGSLAS